MSNNIDTVILPEVQDHKKRVSRKGDDVESVHVERMEYAGKDTADFDRVDGEVAKYTSDVRIHIDEVTNKRLRKLIDRRVLAVMIFTYFLQALDKGTLSFASIMGIQKDTGLVGQQVSVKVPIGFVWQLTQLSSILG